MSLKSELYSIIYEQPHADEREIVDHVIKVVREWDYEDERTKKAIDAMKAYCKGEE